jgi:hypothetical protein
MHPPRNSFTCKVHANASTMHDARRHSHRSGPGIGSEAAQRTLAPSRRRSSIGKPPPEHARFSQAANRLLGCPRKRLVRNRDRSRIGALCAGATNTSISRVKIKFATGSCELHPRRMRFLWATAVAAISMMGAIGACKRNNADATVTGDDASAAATHVESAPATEIDVPIQLRLTASRMPFSACARRTSPRTPLVA